MSCLFPVTRLLSRLKPRWAPRSALASLTLTMTDRCARDAEGGRALKQHKHARKLALVLALQNLVVAACLLVTLYVYWDVRREVQWPASEDNVHIQFVAVADISNTTTVHFDNIHSSNMMHLNEKRNDKIYINCTGPYILYMDVCYKSLPPDRETRGALQLKVAGSETPVASVNLTASSDEVCRGLHSIAYLRAKQEASLHLHCTGGFKIKRLTVGLDYLLGRRCEY